MPWDLDNRKAQEEYRLLAWRFTEEVIEARETFEKPHDGNTMAQYREEVADALHFFIELCLASNVMEAHLLTGLEDVTPIPKSDEDRLELFFREVSKHYLHIYGSDPWDECIRALGMAMMELRQRPWRKDFRQANRARWVMGMHLAFKSFVCACMRTHITAEELYQAYIGKAKINQKRIDDFGIRA